MVLRVFVVLVLLCEGSAVASAQEASISGTVTDESNALLPGTTVTATELSTGRRFVRTTNERGEYRLTAVPAGRYRVQAERPGFSTAIAAELELRGRPE